jgi:hypothetical protein
MRTVREFIPLALAMCLLGTVTVALCLPAKAAAGCRVTLPNASAPPAIGSDHQWYGNAKLLVSLYWPNGIVVFRTGGPGFVQPDGSLAMKFGWWRGVRGRLSITGKRLDAPAPPLRASIPEGYGDTGFQATYIIFPTPGCWQVTGKADAASLTFVTRVVERGVPARTDVER